MTLIEDLKWRGLWHDCTAEEALAERLESGPIALYSGFDPTADSLHVGHLVPLIALRRFQNAGHTPIALAGGATGSIGDPSGKSAERNLLTQEVLKENVAKVKKQLSAILDFAAEPNPAQLVDNADWMRSFSYLDFLRDVGKHFTVNNMVAKESVKARMNDREVGISYTEFSYMLLQAYDFYHLSQEANCELQIGGSDQWGNITAGTELTRKKAGKVAYGLTLPLITKADGTKFGKTEGGAVWLDTARTSVYHFYQFWINVDDRDVISYLKYFTFLDKEEIDQLETIHNENPGFREAHKRLASEMTAMIHGNEAAIDAAKSSKVLFGGSLEGVSELSFLDVTQDILVESSAHAKTELEDEGISILDALVSVALASSRGQAKKDIQGGGVYVNNERVSDIGIRLSKDNLLYGKYILLRKGKKNYRVLGFAK